MLYICCMYTFHQSRQDLMWSKIDMLVPVLLSLYLFPHWSVHDSNRPIRVKCSAPQCPFDSAENPIYISSLPPGPLL